MNTSKELPIGVFDSGVGGLTVLKAMIDNLPHERFIYLGDTARLPYGTKSPSTITKYAIQATTKLVECGIKMLVVACNTASSVALPSLECSFKTIPVIGVIRPGAEAAIKASLNGHIAVIATEATIAGNAYQDALKHINPHVQVSSKACSLFVPLAEEGWASGEIVEKIASKYISSIFQCKENSTAPDTLLLGCTHFPIFKHTLQKVVGENIRLVDSASTTAITVEHSLKNSNLLRKSFSTDNNSLICSQAADKIYYKLDMTQTDADKMIIVESRYLFLTTDDIARFQRVGSIFLGQDIDKSCVKLVDL